MNYLIRKLREDLIATVNNSELPIEVKRLVCFEVLQMVNDASDGLIKKEIEEMQNKED